VQQLVQQITDESRRASHLPVRTRKSATSSRSQRSLFTLIPTLEEAEANYNAAHAILRA